MKARTAVDLDSHSHFGIFGLVAFESRDVESPKWAQIGTAKRNRQGFLDLTFDHWPSNLMRIQIRPVDAPEKSWRAGGHLRQYVCRGQSRVGYLLYFRQCCGSGRITWR